MNPCANVVIASKLLGDLTVRRAAAADFDAVYAVIAEAAAWLQSRGISQWVWFLTDAGKNVVLRRIVAAETYLVFDPKDQPIATFVVQWEDEGIWGERRLMGWRDMCMV